jgi:hypothetical protein
VFAFCLLQAEALREDSSSRGKESRLSSRQSNLVHFADDDGVFARI